MMMVQLNSDRIEQGDDGDLAFGRGVLDGVHRRVGGEQGLNECGHG